MAFWALGKVKNLGNMDYIKEVSSKVGSKLKNYVHVENNDNSDPAIKKLIKNGDKTEQALMKKQLQAYKKLMEIDSLIITEETQKNFLKIRESQQNLLKLQSETQRQKDENQKNKQKNRLIQQIELGKKDIKSVIEQNLLLREQLQKKNAQINY